PSLPRGCLLRLAPGFVELRDSLSGLGQLGLVQCGDLRRAGLQAFVAGDYKRLSLGVTPLAQQRLAELAHSVEPPPIVGNRLPSGRQALAKQGLGLRPSLLLQQVAAETGEVAGYE